jgi:cytoskeletal protein RodZ
MASFGENLRRERELRGIDLREIAEATKISVRFLRALEQDRLDVLPGGLFPRSFVRQYAKHLGLDAERLVAEFVYVQSGERAAETPSPEPAPRQGRSKFLGLLVVAAVAAGSVMALRFQTAEKTPQVAAPLPAAPSPIRPEDRVYPPPASEPATVSASDAGSGLVLTLSARQSCWVAAQVDGNTILNRVMIEGETQTLEAQGEIVLSVGNAGGLSFSVNNRPGVALGRSGEVRRNIVITPGNVESLIETAAGRPSHSS